MERLSSKSLSPTVTSSHQYGIIDAISWYFHAQPYCVTAVRQMNIRTGEVQYIVTGEIHHDGDIEQIQNFFLFSGHIALLFVLQILYTTVISKKEGGNVPGTKMH